MARLSREVALLCNREGEVSWADERSHRHFGALVGASLSSLAVPGTEAKLEHLLDRALREDVDRCELSLVTDGKPATYAFAAGPCESGVVLVGRLVTAEETTTFGRVAAAMVELGELHRETERQKKELATSYADLDRAHGELLDSNRALLTMHAVLDDKNDALQRASDVKTRVVANVSHEFRTPLNSILGLSQLLLDRLDGELSVEQEKQVRFIRSSAESLSDLVNDLLDLSRVEAGRYDLRASEFDVGELFSSLRGMMKPLVRDGVALVIEEPAARTMKTDAGKVSQILRNLVSNAIKFTAKGEIRVRAVALDPHRVRFEVSDTGIGIAPADQERIFDELAQLDNPIQRDVKGTGLGLALSRPLAEMLGGTLTVRSTVGEGSTSVLEIPTVHEEVATVPVMVVTVDDKDLKADPRTRSIPIIIQTAKTLDAAERAKLERDTAAILRKQSLSREVAITRIREALEVRRSEGGAAEAIMNNAAPAGGVVLNVNDSPSNRYFVSRVLASAGWKVLEAESGGEALAMAREHTPNLVVLDIKLPDMSGHEVCRILKGDPETAHILVIQTSATFVTSEGKARGLESGADQYLTQPFEAIELIAMVRGLFRLHEKEVDAREKADALRVADRRKDEFLAMLAHELRNPLSAIMTATTLLEGLELPPMGHRLSATIGRQTRHLSRLVDDLLDVARITSRKIQLRREPLDLRALIERFVGGEAAGITKNHRLAAHIADEPMWVLGDAMRLEQVFSNLVSNAVKYSESGANIAISLTPTRRGEKHFATLRVRDTGVGIATENLGSVFDLFFQVDASLARSQSGLGIGLTIVKQLVDMHDGEVGVSSSGLGTGSEFRIELPLISPIVNGKRAVTNERHPTPLSLLLIDDNVDSCELVALSFENEGHRVTSANDGRQGLQTALGGSFDVAIIDIGLPSLDGYEIARTIRRERPDDAPALIALTGYGRVEDRQRAIEAGFDAHLVKPMDIKAVHRLAAKLHATRVSARSEESAR